MTVGQALSASMINQGILHRFACKSTWWRQFLDCSPSRLTLPHVKSTRKPQSVLSPRCFGGGQASIYSFRLGKTPIISVVDGMAREMAVPTPFGAQKIMSKSQIAHMELFTLLAFVALLCFCNCPGFLLLLLLFICFLFFLLCKQEPTVERLWDFKERINF